jgi:hypothetical protein
MSRQTLAQYSLQLSLFFLLIQVGPQAFAQTQDHEQALVWTADDARLEWGACPPFLPKGCGIAVLHMNVLIASRHFLGRNGAFSISARIGRTTA